MVDVCLAPMEARVAAVSRHVGIRNSALTNRSPWLTLKSRVLLSMQEKKRMNNDSPPHGQPAMGSSVQWLTDLNNAIQACDEQSLWKLLARHGNQREAHDHLVTQVARLAYRVRERPRFSEMFLVPVIDSASARVMDNDAAWKLAASPDVLKITLALDREGVRYTQFTMSKHQIGLDGVQGC